MKIFYGRRSIGMILGLSSMIVVIGQIGGPMVAGVLADLTGNYRAGFAVLAVMVGLGSLFFLLVKRPVQEMPAPLCREPPGWNVGAGTSGLLAACDRRSYDERGLRNRGRAH